MTPSISMPYFETADPRYHTNPAATQCVDQAFHDRHVRDRDMSCCCRRCRYIRQLRPSKFSVTRNQRGVF